MQTNCNASIYSRLIKITRNSGFLGLEFLALLLYFVRAGCIIPIIGVIQLPCTIFADTHGDKKVHQGRYSLAYVANLKSVVELHCDAVFESKPQIHTSSSTKERKLICLKCLNLLRIKCFQEFLPCFPVFMKIVDKNIVLIRLVHIGPSK